RLHRGPREVRRADPPASRRGRPDRPGAGLVGEVGPHRQGREDRLLPGRAARHHGHAPGPGERRPAGVPQERELIMPTKTAATSPSASTRVLGGVTVSDSPLIRLAMEYARKRYE